LFEIRFCATKGFATMKRLIRQNACLGIIVAVGTSFGPAALFGQVPEATPAVAVPADRAADHQAITAMAQAFIKAYNAGDAKAVAALYTEDAEIVDEERARIEGRSNIEALYTSIFQSRPGATIEITTHSLRFLGPDAAKEEGQTRLKPAGKEAQSTRNYSVLYVKNGGKWLYSSVREEQAHDLTHHERLKELEWLLGEWIDESSEATVYVTCRWSDDKNFLIRDFLVHAQGKPVMTVTQRIGWDPLRRQIKSWVFDSEGGYGDALWSRNGNQWIIKSTGVLPDGKTASATNLLSQTGPTQAKWVSSERTLGDQEIPGQVEVVMVRKPPGAESK
jgi:uncharacterized protein (TIGR02246 family)